MSAKSHFQKYFSCIMAVSFIRGENQGIGRNHWKGLSPKVVWSTPCHIIMDASSVSFLWHNFFLNYVFVIVWEIFVYSRSPKGEGGVYCFISVRLSFRPSKIFFVAFFSITVDSRNQIFGHKRHIGIPYRRKRFWTHQIPTSCLSKSGGYHKWELAHSSSCLNTETF